MLFTECGDKRQISQRVVFIGLHSKCSSAAACFQGGTTLIKPGESETEGTRRHCVQYCNDVRDNTNKV